jgi:sigma-B regulation protein RsbU (phosphoserine phosphatase)
MKKSGKSKRSDIEVLESRIDELEELVEQKDAEIKLFKKELLGLNRHIEGLIEKLHTQLKIAHKIQEKLVPTEFPNIPGFEFSTKFQASYESGGDYFDIFEIEDRFRFSLLLSSCSGYGISSLFLSVLLKLTSHIETKKGAPPDKVFSMITKELIPQIADQDAASLFYAVINRRSYEMSYCHHGKNLAFLYRSQEKEVIEIEPTGEAFTKGFKGKIKSETLSLNPKDCLILITEGIYQVKNQKGAPLDMARVKKIIFENAKKSPHQLRNEIFYQIQKWSGKKELSKDVTVLVAEVKDRVLKLAKT